MEENENGKLLIDSVQLRFGDNVVLQSAYVTSYKGRVTGVLGRNGTGKSCLFKCIMGGIRPQNKYIRLNDEPRTDYGHIGLRVKYLPQVHFIPPGMTLPQAYELYGVDFEGLVRFDDKFDCLRSQKVKELSGGERRIAELYMILNSVHFRMSNNFLGLHDEVSRYEDSKAVIIPLCFCHTFSLPLK